ncbi:MAG: DUF1501 domain-containing protein [Candidatus Kapaibacterium sp.]|nr:DUF1501 domain-containing protein [Ignavibacteriota bacterium]MCB9220752.1 DUF1501 domain-containing protein [Ignavibacteria bacterium]
MKRRDFIATTLATGSALTLHPYIAKSNPIRSSKVQSADDFLEDDSIMIIIDLFGGNDGLNTVIPLQQDEYYNLRPNIALKEEDTIRFQSSDLYLHPALVTNVENDGFLGLLQNRNLAIIENVGYENYTMSHFRSSDIWASGIVNTDPSVKLLDGWLGRYFASKLDNYPFEIPEHPLGISIGGEVPLEFRSEKGHMGIALTDPNSFYNLGKGLTPFEDKFKGDSNFEKEFNFIHTIAEQSEIYSQEVKLAFDKGTNEVNYPTTGLAAKMGLISKLISGGLKTKVYHLRLSSFDSHVQQMNEPLSGQHPILLNQLASAISLFMKDATIQGFSKRVAGLTTSEFGRRAYDNGSRGSDHGASNVMFMFAHDDSINFGRAGNPPNLSDLDTNGNPRYQFDFRRLYTDFLETWFGASETDVEEIFGEPILPMGILKPRVKSGVKNYVFSKGRPGIELYPNPVYQSGECTIRFDLKQSMYGDVKVFSTDGRVVKHIYNGMLHNGPNDSLKINGLRSGHYMVTLTIDNKRYSAPLNILK